MSARVDNIASCTLGFLVRRATNARETEAEPFSKGFCFELALSGAIAFFEEGHFMHTPVTLLCVCCVTEPA